MQNATVTEMFISCMFTNPNANTVPGFFGKYGIPPKDFIDLLEYCLYAYVGVYPRECGNHPAFTDNLRNIPTGVFELVSTDIFELLRSHVFYEYTKMAFCTWANKCTPTKDNTHRNRRSTRTHRV